MGQGDFSRIKQVVDMLGLTNTFSNPNLKVTVFVPNNGAFSAAEKKFGGGGNTMQLLQQNKGIMQQVGGAREKGARGTARAVRARCLPGGAALRPAAHACRRADAPAAAPPRRPPSHRPCPCGRAARPAPPSPS
jgi:hypothetical protein